ncbi:unnamed protein product [Cladocopium goreaui]|uniref:Fe2OG dioxygenase domain-containing protein n=1 Tax=Cladocopium goreaui TaxID=2562237 RepID=A0A9P1CWQ8_9DINO|nr:unnamed protein product [Cladocopium goreaui]
MDSKGERLLAAATAPVAAPLPQALRGRWRLSFDPQRLRLREEAMEILEKAEVGSFSPSGCLEEYQARPEIFRSFALRQDLHCLVEASPGFLEVYEQLLLTVLLPWLKELKSATQKRAQFWYQYPPTLRVQPGRSREFKRPHRDAEYGHQIGELNCWMPLTDYNLTQTTLWVESEPDRGDYEPLDISYGQIGIFHGTLCRHHVPQNSSDFTRVSMDFRIGLGEYFDPSWQLDGVKHVHGRREIWL